MSESDTNVVKLDPYLDLIDQLKMENLKLREELFEVNRSKDFMIGKLDQKIIVVEDSTIN